MEVFVLLAFSFSLFMLKISWMSVDLISFCGDNIRKVSSDEGGIVRVFIIFSEQRLSGFAALVNSDPILHTKLTKILSFYVRKYFYVIHRQIYCFQFNSFLRLLWTKVFYQLTSSWNEREVFQ